MPLVYKFPVLEALKKAGYTTYKLRSEKLFSESTLQKFRTGEMVHTSNIETICKLLNCQPGDILQYNQDQPETE